MDLKDYREMPDPGLFEKIQGRLRRRLLLRRGAVVLTAVAAVALLAVVLWPSDKAEQSQPALVASLHQPVATSESEAMDLRQADGELPQVQAPTATQPAPSTDAQPQPAATDNVSEIAFTFSEEVPAAALTDRPTHSSVVRQTADGSPNLGEQTKETKQTISSSLPGSIGDMACDRSGAKLEEVDAQRADGGVCNQAAQPSSSMATQPQPANPSPAKGDPSTGTVHEDDLVWAPNVIVPNGDVDDNRTFKLKYSSEVTQFQIFIYNRGGRLVFNSDDPAFTWNGTSRGTALPQGAYVWVAKFRDSTGHPREEHGTVTIIR